jgi:hypothetical protein
VRSRLFLDADRGRQRDHHACSGECPEARTERMSANLHLRDELEGDQREHRSRGECERGRQQAADVLDDEERSDGAAG